MTPVLVLTDGYIANGAEPWQFPSSKDLPDIQISKAPDKESVFQGEQYLPYFRDENEVRPWVPVGEKGKEHRIGGLEKALLTGNVSYHPENHEKMVEIRARKIDLIAEEIPLQEVNRGREGADLCVLTWGSTFGAVETAVRAMVDKDVSVAHVHLRYIHPFPKNLETVLRSFKKVIIPEMNKGQLSMLIRDRFLIDARSISKMKGLPFTVDEITKAIKQEMP
jgi:2-oxoglutarate ferredoxin oxidoreductase subunit alpha